MANIKQQKKRVLTNEKAHERNVAVKSRLKTAVKKVRERIDSNEKEAALVEYRNCARLLDKAVSKGVIHKNQAADRKSNLALAINKL